MLVIRAGIPIYPGLLVQTTSIITLHPSHPSSPPPIRPSRRASCTSPFIYIHTNLPHPYPLERRGGLGVQLLRHAVVDEACKRDLLRLCERARGGEQVAARHLEARHLGQVGGAADGDGVGGEGGGEVGTRADLRGEEASLIDSHEPQPQRSSLRRH